MLAGLETSHKIGIIVVAGVFIAYALICSFVLPRRNPDFPGRHIGLFLGVSIGITVLMLATIIVLAKEPAETAVNEAAGAVDTTSNETPQAPKGDAAAGKALFAAQGCSSCHTFKPAGSTGTVGPDLDKLAADAKTANRGTEEAYIAESIEDPGAYTVPTFPKGVMPPFHLSDKQVADLVAFVTSGSGG